MGEIWLTRAVTLTGVATHPLPLAVPTCLTRARVLRKVATRLLPPVLVCLTRARVLPKVVTHQLPRGVTTCLTWSRSLPEAVTHPLPREVLTCLGQWTGVDRLSGRGP